MFGLCGPMGLAGWVVMAVVWTALVALVVWAIARLFPGRPRPPEPPGRADPGSDLDRAGTAAGGAVMTPDPRGAGRR